MSPSDLEPCLRRAAQLSGARALVPAAVAGGAWAALFDDASALKLSWQPGAEQLALSAEIGQMADGPGRDVVHGLLARFSAAFDPLRIGFDADDVYKLYAHWDIDLHHPEALAALMDELRRLSLQWQLVLAQPPRVESASDGQGAAQAQAYLYL
ncbi:MAG: hypothetical protein KF871_07245 [Hydrogenophaga sp.]|uniref:hypothetical protein n=1 Tax=Hydrogenophaga sp. TaxID=1904254 RepID=UPI001D6796C8|nr:hypothetical protein [Hydrogenophaga sp.]MBX3609679.1 hypothetical protein [Hydrogenophaga sp.]